MQVKFRVCDRSIVEVLEYALGITAVLQRERFAGTYAGGGRTLRKAVVGDGRNTLGIGAGDVGIGIITVVIANARNSRFVGIGVLHLIGAGEVGVGLGRASWLRCGFVALR